MKPEYKQIHVALDTNMVIMLGQVHQALIEHHLPVKADYTDEEKQLILDRLNSYTKGREVNGKMEAVYKDNGYLRYLLRLNYEIIATKNIVGYVTPTVFDELFINNTIRDHVHSVKTRHYVEQNLTVVRFDENEGYPQEVYDLAKDYVREGVFEEQAVAMLRKSVPNNDAFICAEAAYAGLHLMTENILDFIHRSTATQDYEYRKIIERVNQRHGLAQVPVVDGVPQPGKVVPTVYSSYDFYVATNSGNYRQCEPNLSKVHNGVILSDGRIKHQEVKVGRHYRKFKVAVARFKVRYYRNIKGYAKPEDLEDEREIYGPNNNYLNKGAKKPKGKQKRGR